MTGFAKANNEFALAMYRRLAPKAGNCVFSPFSVRVALAMVYAGARGKTAAQMREALGIPSSDDQPHIDFGDIIQRLNTGGGGQYEMAVANALWGQKGEPLQAEFLDLIVRHYGGAVNVVDFHGAASARDTINQWVADRTRQKIQQLIPPGGVRPDTRLILVNALYFKGQWVLPFRASDTSEAPFYREGGGTVRTALMWQCDTFRHVRAKGYQAIELDYHGDDLSMLVLLPDRKNGLRALEKALTASMLNACVSRMAAREVALFLPPFTTTSATVDMRGPLRALGMTLAFEPFQADFSGINGRHAPHAEALFVSAVLHKAFVQVDEEGTEAAAATAVLFFLRASISARPPAIFRADHPFLFAIRDRHSGAILFLGRMADPTVRIDGVRGRRVRRARPPNSVPWHRQLGLRGPLRPGPLPLREVRKRRPS
jgi:serpin B